MGRSDASSRDSVLSVGNALHDRGYDVLADMQASGTHWCQHTHNVCLHGLETCMCMCIYLHRYIRSCICIKIHDMYMYIRACAYNVFVHICTCTYVHGHVNVHRSAHVKA
jgi:hypothetical protein